MKTIKSYNLRMKIKQLVIFTILTYISIRKYLHNFKKTELHDQGYFLILHLQRKFNCTFKKLTLLIQRYLINKL